MQPYPPLGTLYAAALLRSAGISVALFDSMLNDPEQGFPAAFAEHRPRVVAVYEDNFNFLTKMCLTRMREVAYDILEVSQKAGATVLVNGSDASDHALEYLRRGFRCVLLGEAECTLLETVQHLLNGDDSRNTGGSPASHIWMTNGWSEHQSARSSVTSICCRFLRVI